MEEAEVSGATMIKDSSVGGRPLKKKKKPNMNSTFEIQEKITANGLGSDRFCIESYFIS